MTEQTCIIIVMHALWIVSIQGLFSISMSYKYCISATLPAILILYFKLLMLCPVADSQVYRNNFYIKLLPSSPCPIATRSCLTLSQFAASTELYLQLDDLTLTFQPGHHILHSGVTINDLSTLQILAPVTSESQSVEITCKNASRFDLHNITTVHVRHIAFYGCGGNRAKSVFYLLLENVQFLGHEHSRTALELIQIKAAVINESLFSSYKIGMQRIKMYNEQNSSAGGAVVVTRSNITIIDSVFSNNSAELGGAIFGELDSNMTIVNSTFEGNYVTNMYDDNTGNCNGGALYFQSGCSVKIIASSFVSNNVVKNCFSPNFCEGGAIALVGEATLNITASSDRYECDLHWNVFDDKTVPNMEEPLLFCLVPRWTSVVLPLITIQALMVELSISLEQVKVITVSKLTTVNFLEMKHVA